MISPSRMLLILALLLLTPIFPPLALIPVVLIVLLVRSKRREYMDPQAVAWRQAQAWHRPNG